MSDTLSAARAATAIAAGAGGAPNIDHEFAFSDADFERVRHLIYQRAGISLHAGKQAMVYSRLSRRLRETGQPSFANYLQWLESHSGASGEAEWQEFINCLTTNLTSFFPRRPPLHRAGRRPARPPAAGRCASGAAPPPPAKSPTPSP